MSSQPVRNNIQVRGDHPQSLVLAQGAGTKSAAAALPAALGAPAFAPAAIDPAAWTPLFALVGGNATRLVELLNDHLAMCELLIEQLQAAIELRDHAIFLRVAKSLREAATTVGALTLAEACQKLLQSADFHRASDLTTSMTALDASYFAAHQELERTMQALQESGHTTRPTPASGSTR